MEEIKFKEFLSPESNKENQENLYKLLDYFYLNDPEEVREVLRGRQELDDYFGLDKYKRRWWKIEKDSYSDVGFSKFSDILYEKQETENFKKFVDKFKREVFTYDVYKAGFFTHEKQNYKLFKTLLKWGVLSKEEMDLINNVRTGNDIYFCISRNPVDILFCSTNQSFNSCEDLESQFGEAYYMGLPGAMVDPNRVLLFTSNGKFSRYSAKSLGFKHFRYTCRSWGLSFNRKLAIVRYYPSEQFNFLAFLREVGFDATNKGLETYSDFSWNIPEFENGERCLIYLDYIGIRSDGKYHMFNGECNGQFSCFSNNNGFENCPPPSDDAYKCCCCGYSIDENDVWWAEDDPYCRDCFNERFTTCCDCDAVVRLDDLYSDGNYDYCEHCFNKHFHSCTKCGEAVSKYNTMWAEDDPYCEYCFEKIFLTCNECGESVRIDDALEFYNVYYCEDCYDKLFDCCSVCGYVRSKDALKEVDGNCYCEDCNLKEAVNE